MKTDVNNIAVLGAGAWGSALAIHLSRVGHQVALWDHHPQSAERLQQDRENKRYLAGIGFPESLEVTSVLSEALQGVEAVLVVVPSQAFREVLSQLKTVMGARTFHLAWATKGFEPDTGLLLHQIAEQEMENNPMAVLSGPTFAKEVAKGLPTAMVSASLSVAESQFWASTFHYEHFRMYTQNDVVGVEVGGAYKNIMAIATGVSDGLGLGANARAALVSRGMVEMMRLGHALGAQQETLMGLAGLGDLVLTCTDDLSRNRRFGLLLASSGNSSEQVMAKIGQVVEGVKAVNAVKMLAEKYGLDLPIMQQVYQIVHGHYTPKQAVAELMKREGKSEAEFY